MKIERVDDKTVKCFISNEEMAEYPVQDYKSLKYVFEKTDSKVAKIVEDLNAVIK